MCQPRLCCWVRPTVGPVGHQREQVGGGPRGVSRIEAIGPSKGVGLALRVVEAPTVVVSPRHLVPIALSHRPKHGSFLVYGIITRTRDVKSPPVTSNHAKNRVRGEGAPRKDGDPIPTRAVAPGGPAARTASWHGGHRQSVRSGCVATPNPHDMARRGRAPPCMPHAGPPRSTQATPPRTTRTSPGGCRRARPGTRRRPRPGSTTRSPSAPTSPTRRARRSTRG